MKPVQPQQQEPIVQNNTENKSFYPIYLPYCESNEKISTKFLQTINRFTNNKFKLTIMWRTKRIKNLFPLKDKNVHRANVIYEGNCQSPECAKKYIGETKINALLRWNQHNDINHNSSPAEHVKNNQGHTFSWHIITIAPTDDSKRKILEAIFIAIHKPGINDQVKHRNLTLFKHGIT